MEDAFLEKVYNQYKKKDLSQYCFVFPTRRAAYVFRQRFLQSSDKTTWLPEILAIRDFVEKLTPYPIADDLVMLLLLHEVASQYNKDLTLEEFFPWGKILLKDFNEIDQNLIDAEILYRHSYEEREIDARFSLQGDDLEDVAGFWKLFSNKPLSTLQENFLANWKSMPEIYAQFKQKLAEKKMVYEGLAYRHIVESLNDDTLTLPWKKLVFAGFYALSVAERSILERLHDLQMVDIFWDVDGYYFDNNWHEAGLYLRRNDFLKQEFSWKNNYFKEQPKTIHITGAPLKTAQVKWISNVLKEKINDPSFNPATSVIVLPDETMLLSLLYSLPEELQGLNITMGFPVKQSYLSAEANAFLCN